MALQCLNQIILVPLHCYFASSNYYIMKRFYKLLVLAFTIFIAMSASAYDFMVDGICYNVLPDGNSVEVTFQQEPGSNGYITA